MQGTLRQTMKYHGIDIPQEKIADFCHKHRIQRLAQDDHQSGDIMCDGEIDGDDLLVLLNNWGGF